MTQATLVLSTRHAATITVPYEFPPWPVATDMATTLQRGQLYEPGTTTLMAAVLRPGDTAVDVGGHVGLFAKMMGALVGPTGRVLTVEATPWNADVLRAQVADLPWVEVVHAAVGMERSGTITMHRNADNDGGHAIWDPALHPANLRSKAQPESVTVPATRLDHLLVGWPTPRLMKLDIEGSEYAALKGASLVLARETPPPFVVCEINRSALQWAGSSEQELRTYMAQFGYECWHVADTDPILRELGPLETITGHYVFNVLFKQPDADVT